MRNVTSILVLVFACSACATSGKRQAEVAKNCDLPVLSGPVDPNKYRIIDTVTARTESPIYDEKDLKKLVPQIQKEACQLGADAIVLDSTIAGRFSWAGPLERRTAKAVAVKIMPHQTAALTKKADRPDGS